jgi:1-deoxy-D-xylulose-5-phosphate reductoisomerase
VFNAANEVCVEAFVDGRLDFLGIVDTVGNVLDEHIGDPDAARQEMTLDGVLGADAWARARAAELVEQR